MSHSLPVRRVARVVTLAWCCVGLSEGLAEGLADGAETIGPGEMTLFDFLGTMVEDDEGWLDPLHLKDQEDLLNGADGATTQNEAPARKAPEVIEESEQ